MFAPLFPRLYEGILHDVFIQKAAVAWDNAPSSRIMVSLLLPGPMEADQWLHTVRANRHMWRLQARHIWEKIQPNWSLIAERVWTKHATGLPYQALYRRLFLLEYTEESRWLENSYKGPNAHWIWQQWKRCRAWFAEQTTAQFPNQWVSTLCLQRLDQMDVLSWQWIDCHERIVVQVWHTKQGIFRRKLPPDVRDDPMLGQ